MVHWGSYWDWCPHTGMCAPILAAGEGSYWDECPPYWCRGTLHWGLCPHTGAGGLCTGMCAPILVQGAPYWAGCPYAGWAGLILGQVPPPLVQEGSRLGSSPPPPLRMRAVSGAHAVCAHARALRGDRGHCACARGPALTSPRPRPPAPPPPRTLMRMCNAGHAPQLHQRVWPRAPPLCRAAHAH